MFNFDEQIKNHKKWIMLVNSIFYNSSSSFISPEVLSDHTSCELGKWITESESEKYFNDEEFLQLKKHHQLFHDTASLILMMYQQNNLNEAAQMEQDFKQASREIIQLLESLKGKYSS